MPQRGKPDGVTDVPKPSEEGLRALVEENVKNTVKGLKEHSLLAKVCWNLIALGSIRLMVGIGVSS